MVIKGARLPYIIRRLDSSRVKDEAASLLGKREKILVTLIRECHMNDFKQYDSVSEEYKSALEKQVIEFIFTT